MYWDLAIFPSQVKLTFHNKKLLISYPTLFIVERYIFEGIAHVKLILIEKQIRLIENLKSFPCRLAIFKARERECQQTYQRNYFELFIRTETLQFTSEIWANPLNLKQG